MYMGQEKGWSETWMRASTVTFSGKTGWRVGGGGQGSARRDRSGSGRGFGHSDGGGRVDVGGVSDVTHLVFRLRHETSGQA